MRVSLPSWHWVHCVVHALTWLSARANWDRLQCLPSTHVVRRRIDGWRNYSISSARTHTLIHVVPTNTHWAIFRAVQVLRLVSMTDSRTERLRVLLPVSIRPSCIAHMNLIQLSFQSGGKQQKVVAVVSDRKNTVFRVQWQEGQPMAPDSTYQLRSWSVMPLSLHVVASVCM